LSEFADFDANGDGILTLDEFMTFLTRYPMLIPLVHEALIHRSKSKTNERKTQLDNLFINYPASPGSGFSSFVASKDATAVRRLFLR
jgi:hypothetical protein